MGGGASVYEDPMVFWGFHILCGGEEVQYLQGVPYSFKRGVQVIFSGRSHFLWGSNFFVGRGLIYFWGGVQVFFGSQFHGGSQVLKGLFRGCQFFFQVL